MAQSPDVQVDGEVREGLLCPICLLDLKTVKQLQEHFNLAHPAEEQDVLQTLKGLFGKAKRRILKQDGWTDDLSRPFEEYNSVSATQYNAYDSFFPPQEIGIMTNHTAAFKKHRDYRIDRYVTETNKLLIRLDRLITEAPDDPDKRKDYEKSVVPWIPDEDVRLCPGCAKSFGLSRRRHHCRLCGGVLCHACSQFMDFDSARRLIQITVSDDQLAVPTSRPLMRRGSNTSLLSVVSISGEPHIRICKDCKVLLTRREKQIEQRSVKPVIVQKYEKMKEYIDEIEKLAPLYGQMVNSLCCGETVYHLQDVKQLKFKLSKTAEAADTISKVISQLEDGDPESATKVFQLQNSIRMAVSEFLKNTVLGLPSLPSEEDVLHFQKLRQQQIEQKIQREKDLSLQTISKTTASSKNSNNTGLISPRKEQVSVESGWSVSHSKVDDDDDPMLQQMNLIRNYIQQARIDHKYDEVHMLEANLKELQMEYIRQKKEKERSLT